MKRKKWCHSTVHWEPISYCSGPVPSINTTWSKENVKGVYFPRNNLVLQTQTPTAASNAVERERWQWGGQRGPLGARLRPLGLPCALSFTLAISFGFRLASITSTFDFSKQQSIENSIFHSSKRITRKSEMQGNKEHLIIRILPLAVGKPHGLARFQGQN